MGRSYTKLPAHFKLTDLDPILVIPATFAGSQGRVKFVPAWLSGLRLVGCTVAVTDIFNKAGWRFKGVTLRPLNVLTVLDVDVEKGTLVGVDDSMSIVKAPLQQCVMPIWTGASYRAANLDAVCNWITEAAWGAKPQRNCTVVDTDNGPLVIGPPYRTLVTTVEALSGIGVADAAKKALQVVSGTGLDMSSVEAALTSFIWSAMSGTANVWLPSWNVRKGSTELEQVYIEAKRKMWHWIPGRVAGPTLAAAVWRSKLYGWHLQRQDKMLEKVREVSSQRMRMKQRQARKKMATRARMVAALKIAADAKAAAKQEAAEAAKFIPLPRTVWTMTKVKRALENKK